jgi:hypothetical protein
VGDCVAPQRGVSRRRNLGGGFVERRKSAFSFSVFFTALLHAHLVSHKIKTKMRDCSRSKRLSGKPEDVAARRAFDSAVGIAPRVKVRVFPGKGAVDLTF